MPLGCGPFGVCGIWGVWQCACDCLTQGMCWLGRNVQQNAITNIQAGAFDGLTSLEELYVCLWGVWGMSHWVCDCLTQGMCWAGRSLYSNAITHITAGVFDGLASLRRL